MLDLRRHSKKLFFKENDTLRFKMTKAISKRDLGLFETRQNLH